MQSAYVNLISEKERKVIKKMKKRELLDEMRHWMGEDKFRTQQLYIRFCHLCAELAGLEWVPGRFNETARQTKRKKMLKQMRKWLGDDKERIRCLYIRYRQLRKNMDRWNSPRP